ncbi:EamA family transporter [Thermomicrobium sp. CFH 73360]|uniref:DMT family transporter n=1 Tax=Thermomicrobium sp. CFH 73360 TaxID=2951987 RepID=UPI0020774F1F|nr:EamA family transporter [Thermomicrobium sp. CFH 73360]MCM8746504.1 EamA family transporter [Thermomicrobium sp. CFH 73360]
MRVGQLVQLVLLGTIWGSSYLFIKVAVEGFPPVLLVEGRLLLGAAVLLAIRWWTRQQWPACAVWPHLVVMALVGNVVPFLLIAWSEQHIDSGLASVLNATTPFFTVLFAVLAFRAERITWGKAMGVGLGFVGVAVLSGADLTAFRSASTQGQLAVLVSSACYGLGFAYARRFLRGAPLALAAAQIGLAALLLVPLVLASGIPGDLRPTLPAFLALSALGVVSSGMAYVLYYRLIASAGAVVASLATYLMPPVGVTLGWAVLGEPIGWRLLVGVVLILAGMAVVQGRSGWLALRRTGRLPVPAED